MTVGKDIVDSDPEGSAVVTAFSRDVPAAGASEATLRDRGRHGQEEAVTGTEEKVNAAGLPSRKDAGPATVRRR